MRRVAAGVLPLLVASCAGAQTETETAGPAASCETTDCFFDRDVRDFDIVDRNTVVVYVGALRCPFVVELQDMTCDVRLTPAIEFFQTALGNMDRLTSVQGGRICATTRGLVLYSGIVAPAMLRQQEALERSAGIQRPGGFGRSDSFDRSFPVDTMSIDVCRVGDIRSITDDQLIELYAESGAPPPPIGEGQLEVPDPGDGVLDPDSAADAEQTTSGEGTQEDDEAERPAR